MENERTIRRELRSPRAAAIAGILFSVLMIVGRSMIVNMVTAHPADISGAWLKAWSGTVSVVLVLVPFAGISFLWFTGVIRDQIGEREDRFFATIFLGSGILYVGMLFIWAASLGAIFRSYPLAAAGILEDNDLYVFGFALMNEIIGTYSLRMAGMYMTSICALWTKTSAMPRWATLITLIVALGFIFFAGAIKGARFIFPGWVLLVSIYILVQNYRRTQAPEDKNELSVDD